MQSRSVEGKPRCEFHSLSTGNTKEFAKWFARMGSGVSATDR